MKRVDVNVRGRVQGVGYRYYVMDGAEQAGISGYVRNLQDGSVRIVAEGSEEALLAFIRYIYATGDPVIWVDYAGIEWGFPTGEFSKFEIRH
jgi:acylphosphatase